MIMNEMTEEIRTESGTTIQINKKLLKDHIEISLRTMSDADCIVHWGLSRHKKSPWEIPPESSWPVGTITSGDRALQTPFMSSNDDKSITFRLDKDLDYSSIVFVLLYPDKKCWDNNHGRNYHVSLPVAERTSPSQVLRDLLKHDQPSFESTYSLDDYREISIAGIHREKNYRIILITNIHGPLLLHWGMAQHRRHEWVLPPVALRPPRSEVIKKKALQTQFLSNDHLNTLTLEFSEQDAPMGITLVLKEVETGEWINNHGENFYIPVHESSQKETSGEPPQISSIADEIIRAEMGHNSWTLMHRFNLCYDLLDRVDNDVDGLALIFVWMRFSAIRQLEWQRNYNTKPRELSHAQDRLTLKLAGIYRNSSPEKREFIRLIMATVGRGGEGQRIRDEILNIMHRHRIKEVTGHFMEEWHKKLHNNTTPDDIVICEAYLEFLGSDGDLEMFYGTLIKGGVTKERLENFDRPIVTEPDFVPGLKEGLIEDFDNYLRVLKSVHSGTDLESAISAADHLLDPKMQEIASFILRNRKGKSVAVESLVTRTSEMRKRLHRLIDSDGGNERVRDLLYLDLAFEEFLRVAVERTIHTSFSGKQIVTLINRALESVLVTHSTEELTECSRHWSNLMGQSVLTPEWSLHAKSVVDRITRVIGGFIDHYYEVLQPKAESLGNAFHAESWTITLFSEEVVRGQPAFVLSMLLRRLDPVLRKSANLGDWQVISRGEGSGQVEVVESLRSLQGKHFDCPTIVIADQVKGDEEPPEGVTAIITPDVTDVVSHVAVRARNAHLLFATCYDRDTFNRLKSFKGGWLNVRIQTSGDVTFEEGSQEVCKATASGLRMPELRLIRPQFRSYALPSSHFSENMVGGKSLNLNRLRDQLPEWIHLPLSVALPFGVFEKVLTAEQNSHAYERYNRLTGSLKTDPEEILSQVRETILALSPPPELVSALRETIVGEGLAWSEAWEDAWMCIKRVWASKWNDRAFFSRKARGIPHEDLFMAVLIQEVVDAEYAFVIHTTNPLNNTNSELYAEVVLGLGETLVGNYPGRALSFVADKKSKDLHIITYPNKSIGLFGRGLIFRSDSNGEDLTDYAGAGLYESFLLEPPMERVLEYTHEPIVWNDDFRNALMGKILEVGTLIETLMGSPQDIEGAFRGGDYHVVQTRPQVGTEHGA